MRRSRTGRRRPSKAPRGVVVLGALLLVAAVAVGVRAVGSAGAGTSGQRQASAQGRSARQANGPSPVFATILGGRVRLHMPAPDARLIAIGFHQANNAHALDMKPVVPTHAGAPSAEIKAALSADAKLRCFVMNTRGRAAPARSAADCAVIDGTTIVAPVDGVVRVAKTYMLEGRYEDLHVEIEPDGAASVRVVMVHLTGVRLKVGQRVLGGVTPVGHARHLVIDSQVNRYLPGGATDHTHIQVNPVGGEL